MTSSNAVRRLRHPPTRMRCRILGLPGMSWWFTVMLCCGLVLLPHHHRHRRHPSVLARAQFVTNTLPLNAMNALLINGIAADGQSGTLVAGVGDVNGDNVTDFVIGAPQATPFGLGSGQLYLLFGRNASSAWEPGQLELSANGVIGVVFDGFGGSSPKSASVAGVQDVNGDGLNDLLIGTSDSDKAHLVFGRNGTWPAVVNLTEGAFDGVRFVGLTNDRTGSCVSSAGDVNDDGTPDFAIGVPGDPGQEEGGRMDVLYGLPPGSMWPAVVNLTTYVNVSTGFYVRGNADGGACGQAVSGLGDVNGDGVSDVAVVCRGGSSSIGGDAPRAGVVAVVFGSAHGLPHLFALDALNGTNGFVIIGQRANDSIGGGALAPIGDVNADALDDFAIGAPVADANALLDSGEVYVLFGRNASVTPWPARVNVSSLNGNNGFTMAGSVAMESMGQSVSRAGDVNADGLDDLFVGASGAGVNATGSAFVLYGRNETWPARINSSGAIDGIEGGTLQGVGFNDSCGSSVSYLGDVNGDGRIDLAVGCPLADPDDRFDAGLTAVIFDPVFTSPPTASPTPTTAPTTRSPIVTNPTSATTGSPTPSPSPCNTQGAFVPPGATCVNGVLVTTSNTTTPTGATVTLATSITIVGGASFVQPGGSTLVFVTDSSGQSTLIAVEDGGCAAIGGDAVVNFMADPSNGGGSGTTDALVLVTSDCLTGEFGSVSATTSFTGDECVALGEGMQLVTRGGISVTFAVSNTCDSNDSGLSTAALVGIIMGAVVGVTTVLVLIGVMLNRRAREQRAKDDVKLSRMKMRPGS